MASLSLYYPYICFLWVSTLTIKLLIKKISLKLNLLTFLVSAEDLFAYIPCNLQERMLKLCARYNVHFYFKCLRKNGKQRERERELRDANCPNNWPLLYWSLSIESFWGTFVSADKSSNYSTIPRSFLLFSHRSFTLF